MDDKLSTASIQKLYNIINGALKQAKKNRIISINPAEGIELPKLKKKEVRILTHEEQSRFVEAFKEKRLRALFIMSLSTDLRIGVITG